MTEPIPENPRKTMAYARLAAQRFGHRFILPEHMLHALLQLEGCMAARVLQHLGVDCQDLRQRLESSVRRGSAGDVPGQLPFTPDAARALEHAFDEFKRLGHNSLLTGHLLLGLLHDPNNGAARTLARAGVTLERARDALTTLPGIRAGA